MFFNSTEKASLWTDSSIFTDVSDHGRPPSLPRLLWTPENWRAQVRVKKTKNRNIWLHGRPNHGKSYWMRRLSEKLKVHEWDWNKGGYQNVPSDTQIIWIDEMHPKRFVELGRLNSLADAPDGKVTFNPKMEKIVSIERPLVVVTSNYSIT
jgi:hypothetical protein